MDAVSDTTPQKQHSLPLNVVFEGQCWKLTVLLHSTIAIWLVVTLQDRDQYFFDISARQSVWTHELFYYLGAMLMGAFMAALAVGVLSLNLRPVEKHTWRARSCRSVVALVIIDMIAMNSLIFACSVVFAHQDDVQSVPATVFVTSIGLFFTISFNVLYVQMFGCCLCCHCRPDAGAKLLEQSKSISYHNIHLPIAGVASGVPIADVVPSKEGTISNDRETRRVTFNNDQGRTVLEDSKDGSVAQIEVTESAFAAESSESLQERHEPLTDEIQIEQDRRSSDAESAPPPKPPRLGQLKRWDTMKLVEEGTSKLHTRKASSSRSVMYKDEKANDQQREHTPKTPSRRGSMGPDVIGIVRRFLRKDEDSEEKPFSLAQMFSPSRLWNAVREEPGRFRYAVWIKSALLTSIVVLLYICVRTISVISNLSRLYKKNRENVNDNLDELNSCLNNLGWTDGVDRVTKTLAAELYSIADAVIPDLCYTAWIGYSLGALVGLYSLVAVLIQHKRISLAVSDGLHAFRVDAMTSAQETESPWPAFQKKYPMLEASYFLAILSSTAVLQLHIVGMTVSILLGILMNATKLSVFFDIVGFYILAYVLVFVIEYLTMRFSSTFLISSDGAHILHPRWFNFTIVLLSMVHLVVGLLYALWRVLYMVVTTVFVLNRLDVSLFATGKKFDNGHNAFMSMLVLTVLIQEDHESFIIRSTTNTHNHQFSQQETSNTVV